MINVSEIVKQRLEELKNKGYKVYQSDIAQALGCSQGYISDLINGEKRWNEEITKEVFEYLGIVVKYYSKKFKGVRRKYEKVH